MLTKDTENKETYKEISKKENYSRYYWIGLVVSFIIGLFAFLGIFFIKNKKARWNYIKGVLTTIIIIITLTTILFFTVGPDKLMEII